MNADGDGDSQQTLLAKDPTNESTPQHSLPISLVVHKILQVPVIKSLEMTSTTLPLKDDLPAKQAPDRGPL